MKKWIAFLLFAVMMLSLAACGITDKETEPAETTAAEEQAPEETAETVEVVEEVTEETLVTEAVEETEEITTEEITEIELVQETFWVEEGVEYPMSFYFSSGAGGWGTELYLNEDGTFDGYFHDSEMGEIGEDYPNGTVYTCEFSGKFGAAERLDMYTYSTKLLELTLDRPAGESWIEDGVKYISATPYGLENCENFMIYLPNTPPNLLAEDTLFWWPGRYHEDYTTLHGYGLMNVEDGSCFFAMME